MERTDSISNLQRVADYHAARRTLSLSGRWSVLFGAVSVAAGCLWTPVDWVLTVLGIALAGTGVWNIVAPRPTGILLDGITLLVVGAYNLGGAVLAVMDGLPPSPGRALLGALQLVWGVQRLRGFRQFANAFLEQPSDAEAQQIEQTVGAIRRATAKDLTGLIEFGAGGVRRRPWKARLAGEYAVFVEVAGPGLLVATRPTVQVIALGNVPRGGALEADLAVGATRLRVTISPESLRLYEQWKAGAPMPRPVAA